MLTPLAAIASQGEEISCGTIFNAMVSTYSEGAYLTVPGIRSGGTVFYRYSPPTAGKETFVLLHGLTADSSDWADVAEILKSKGYGVVIRDSLATGKTFKANASSGYRVEEVTLADQVAADASLVQQLGLKNVHIVGHSHGGAVSQELAAMPGLDVKGVHLVTPYLKRVDFNIVDGAMQDSPFAIGWNMSRTWMDAIAPGVFRSMTETNVNTFGASALVQQYRTLIKARVVKAGGTISEAELTSQANAIYSEVKDVLHRDFIATPSPVPENIPYQLIYGTNDRINPFAHMNEFQNSLESSGRKVKSVTINGGSHYLPTEEPEKIAGALIQGLP